MSVEAIAWALAQQVDRSSAKFVLVAMANCANADMTCWPSIQYLTEATCQDRKTVMENVRRLREAGFINPTGEHRGKTSQVAVYQLQEPAQKRASLVGEQGNGSEGKSPVFDAKSTENGTVQTVPKTDAKSTVFPAKESRFSVETVPKTVHGTVKEPKEEPSRNQKEKKKEKPGTVAVCELIEAGFDLETAEEFIATKAERKAPLTPRAWKDHVRESAKAGWTPMQAAEKVMAKTWKGFEAKYVEGERPGLGRAPPNRQAALEERNRAVVNEFLSNCHEAN